MQRLHLAFRIFFLSDNSDFISNNSSQFCVHVFYINLYPTILMQNCKKKSRNMRKSHNYLLSANRNKLYINFSRFLRSLQKYIYEYDCVLSHLFVLLEKRQSRRSHLYKMYKIESIWLYKNLCSAESSIFLVHFNGRERL